jgi:hypothetical protein
MPLRSLSWLLAPAFVSLWVLPAAGQSWAEAGAGVAPASGVRAPAVLAVRGDRLNVERLRALLSTEFAREVVLEHDARPDVVFGVLTLTYHRESAELAVTWDSGGQTLTRLVAAPSDAAALESDAALLAGNLAREQVEDLLPSKPVTAAPVAAAALPAESAPEHRAVTVGLFYPLATHYGHAEVSSSFDLNLLYGRVGAIDGAQIGGVNVVTREASPAASMQGLQLGVAANVVEGKVGGLQFAGVLNYVGGPVRGGQFALGANFSEGAVHGVQDAFVFNRAGAVRGLQLSAVNVAGDVDGVQIGLVNVARRVRGASIGLVNVADDIDGVPLAPFSVTRSGGVHPSVWSGTSGLGNVGVKLATRYTYTLFFGSYHRAYDLGLVGGGFAMGGSVELGAGFRSDLDLSGTYLIAPAESFDLTAQRSYHEQLVQPRVRLMVAFRAAQHFSAFLGVAAVGQIRSQLSWDEISGSVGPEIFGGIEL